MYYCTYCGSQFSTPRIVQESHGLDWPPYEEVPVCPSCGESELINMVQCSCCCEYTPKPYIKTADGNIYCENCYTTEDPEW